MKRSTTFALLALTGALLSACNPQPTPDTAKPSVSLVATPNTVTNAGQVTLTATASDDVALASVSFYKGTTLIFTDVTAPYTATDNITSSQNGSVTYRAVATDTSGNTAEATTAITVNIDNTAPTVSVTAAPNPLVAAGVVTFTATATDNVGVTKVDFFDNGVLVATDTTAPFTANKAYAFADNGVHTITAKAYDALNNVSTATTTTTVSIVDANEPNDSVAAATLLTVGTPINGAITAQARDIDYFKFDAAAGDPLKLTVKSVSANAASTLDPYVMILMPDGKTVLEKDDDGGTNLESEIRFNTPVGGTYTVVVTSFEIHDDPTATDDKATNTYQIALSRR
ncbi:pre-peptidase C-terminal domain-containing protein [Deinococcus sp. HMF7604]|uniref:Ig-like domain-containing protein n=1 Tax=Deinococcus betulae TaxID=2873312 RepID=UPI001CCFAA85|nr:Ig-like domain-containing protein [Deinococcus betulae]MBZ9750026.1 pre-peptidase C-terminal domain-containing protein [Deinococcus betulae]